VITDLVQIKRLGEKKHAENMRFRRWLKSHTFVERQFRNSAIEITDEIDCRQCGECCRVTEVELTERDVEHLAKHVGASKKRFLADYTMQNDEGNLILKRSDEAGCVFLQGNECTVYDARPADCERFPHLLSSSDSLERKMWTMPDRATYCPIVYNWLEKVKSLTKFQPSA
jgi:Fe-S-cluster containining protein